MRHVSRRATEKSQRKARENMLNKSRISPPLRQHLPLTRAAGVGPLSWLKQLQPVPLAKGEGPQGQGDLASRAQILSQIQL